jgi:hypothetical protein
MNTSSIRFSAIAVVAAVALAGCAGTASTSGVPPAFVDAHQVSLAGSWEGTASILTVDSGAMQSQGRYDFTEPVDGVFTVRETLTLGKPAELQEGEPLTTTAEQDLLGVIAPDGSIRLVKITDDVVFQGWFTDDNTLQMVLWEPGEHAVVGVRTATRLAE